MLLERAASGSRPGERRDRHVVCLAIEGGGMRGSVSAGMCVALEAAGLVPAFDRVPPVDLELIFDELLARRRPFCSAGLAKGPDFRPLAVSPSLSELRVLSDLRGPDELLGAVRASCSVPVLNGTPYEFRGEQLIRLLRARPARYNREAEDLEALASRPRGRPLVSQVTVSRERRLVEHLDTEVTRVQECIRLGASAVASLVFATGPGQLESAA